MRMTPDHLFADSLHHVVDCEIAIFFRDLGMEHHLEQDIAQFLGHVSLVVHLRRIDVFVGFFDKIR